MMKDYIQSRNLSSGVWRAFATQKDLYRTELQSEIFKRIEPYSVESSEPSHDAVFSFLTATYDLTRIIGKQV